MAVLLPDGVVAHLGTCIFAVAWLQLLKAGYSGVLPSLLGEQFPVSTRAIGVSLSFSTAVTIFGGFAPFIATWLIAKTGDPLSPSFYLVVTAAMSAVALADAATAVGARGAGEAGGVIGVIEAVAITMMPERSASIDRRRSWAPRPPRRGTMDLHF